MNLKSLVAALFVISFTAACGRSEHDTNTSSQAASASALPACQITSNCSQALPQLKAPTGFSGWYKQLITRTGSPLHRGRDVVAVQGAPLWIQAKFSYGILDADLHEENVDIYLSQSCTSGLRKIGQAFTSLDGEQETVEGVVDTGGRISVDLASLGVSSLPIGRHRVVLVVPGDNSLTELYITIVDPRQKMVVSDIDGTLTQSELAAAKEIVGADNVPRPDSVAALNILANKGYHIVYLTARPEWLMAKTRAWLNSKGFPAGTVRTTNLKIGLSGTLAVLFKTHEMSLIENATGIVPSIGIGNKDTDALAFSNVGVPGSGSYYHQLHADLQGGSRFENYSELTPEFSQLASVCQ